MDHLGAGRKQGKQRQQLPYIDLDHVCLLGLYVSPGPYKRMMRSVSMLKMVWAVKMMRSIGVVRTVGALKKIKSLVQAVSVF